LGTRRGRRPVLARGGGCAGARGPLRRSDPPPAVSFDRRHREPQAGAGPPRAHYPEIAASNGIPERARTLFAAIARLVERSFFGARPVGERDWLGAREAYSTFALPTAWRA
jgi:hypothetical protein